VKVDTSQFRALTEQVAALETEMAGLRHMLTGGNGAALEALVEMGRVLGRQEQADRAARRRARRSRPGYLQVYRGGGTS